MDGMTHAAFRSICFEYGASAATTEMIAAVSYGRARKKRLPRFEELLMRRPEEKYLTAQIIGCEPESMAIAAERLCLLKRFDAIEINMGCPARKVVGSGNGSALLRNPELAGQIISAVCGASNLPVRLKMRLGWDDEHINADRIAALAEKAGCSLITLHGRTREQMYRGDVRIDVMRQVRANTGIAMLANGGVKCALDAASFVRSVGADGVSIGRAALKMPWIFDDIRILEKGMKPSFRNAEERISLLMKLAERSMPLKPEKYVIMEMRKFASWYLPGLRNWETVKGQINGIEDHDAYRRILSDYLDRLICTGNDAYLPELAPDMTLDTV